jgi:hypothetical protein
MTRGLKTDVEQRDQTRAPRNRDPREAEVGPLVESCPGSARAAAAADVNDGPVTMYAVGPAGMQDSPIWAASVLNRKRADSRAERTDTRAAMTAEGAGRRSRGVQRLGRDRQTAVAGFGGLFWTHHGGFVWLHLGDQLAL